MPTFPRRRAATVAAGTVAALVAMTGVAQAHAIVSPAVAESGRLQQFTLSVPTEKEKTATTKVELDVPAGFVIDSYEPSPGWRRQVVSSGSGDSATVQRIVWSGGHVPTEEDAVFRFNAEPSKAQPYRFRVEQSYADGSVVDWSGPETSDTPAPTIDAATSLGQGSSGNTLAIVAIVLGAIALVLSAIGLKRGAGRPLT